MFFIVGCIFNLFVIGVYTTSDGLTVTGIFKDGNNKNTCDLKSGNCNPEIDGIIKEQSSKPYGPKFQKVHLQLPRINPVRTGYVRKINITKNRQHHLKTLAVHPPIFEIKDFLSDDECSAIIHLAKQKGMKEASKVTEKINIPSENSHELFDKWDRSLNGLLSAREVSEIQEIKHLLLTEEDISKMYSDLGIHANENGDITYGELAKATFDEFQKYLNDFNEKRINSSMHNIENTWLWHDENELLVYDDVLLDYHERLSNLTRIPKKLIEESEPLQVTLFKNGSYSECRHDSQPLHPDVPCCLYGVPGRCRNCRYMSIIYFLNDVEDGELVFPLANNRTLDWNSLHKDTIKGCSRVANRSIANVVIKPEKGKAIMWYNNYIGRDTGWTATLDPLSFYGANYVNNGDKWIATTWINIIGDGVNDLRPWRMGSNLLSRNNIREDIIEQMRNDDFIEGETYLHDAKLIAIEENDVEVDPDLRSEKDDQNTTVETRTNETINQEQKEENIGNDGTDSKAVNEVSNKQNEIIKQSRSEVKVDEALLESKGGATQGTKEDAAKILNKKTSAKSNLEIRKQDEDVTTKNDMSEENSTNMIANRKNFDDTSREKAKEEDKSKIDGRNADKKQDSKITESKEVHSTEEKQKIIESKKQLSDDSSDLNPKVSNRRNRSPEDGEGPLGPPVRGSHSAPFNGAKLIENKLVTSVLILIEELTREELEIVARSLHEKLQLACIPIMVNPIGPM